MIQFEMIALAIGKYNGAFEPGNKAFDLKNAGLLRTYRPEKKADSEHYRIFTSVMGGFKAFLADLAAKCDSKNNKLTLENTLGDLLAMYGFRGSAGARPIVLFLRTALKDESITANTLLKDFQEIKETL